VRVQLKIYNLLGELVRVIVDEHKFPGRYTVEWDGRNEFGEAVSSGIYLYQLVAGEFRETKRMVLLK
jgi:flagellar hook assembly protein FlgD